MPKLKPKREVCSNVLSAKRRRAAAKSRIRSRVRPPELVPNLNVLVMGTPAEIQHRMHSMHAYVGLRREFTALEQLELKLLRQKLTTYAMLARTRASE